jgi:hypothetical protein
MIHGIVIFIHGIVVFLLNWPWALVLCFAVVGVAIGFVLHFPFDFLSARLNLREHNEIAGHFLAVVGVIYAVVLAFVVVTAWQQFDHTEEVSMQEQHAFSNLFDTLTIDDANSKKRRVIQLLLREYALKMEGEWEQMKRGESLCLYTNFQNEREPSCQPSFGELPPSRLTNDLMLKIRRQVMGLVSTAGQRINEQRVSRLEGFVDAREHRRHHYREPPLQFVLWIAFFVGALITIGVTYLSEAPSSSQLMRATALCAMIGIMFALALVFDSPFIGKDSISGNQWCNIVAHFDLEIDHGVVQARVCPLD